MTKQAPTIRWFQLRWSSWLALICVGAALVACHTRENIYGTGANLFRGSGWPFVHPDNSEFWISNALFLNVIIGTLMLASIGFVFERGSRSPTPSAFGLSALLQTVAIVGCLLGLVRWQERSLPDGFTLPVRFVGNQVLLAPTAVEHHPWYIAFPILVGIGLTIHAASYQCVRIVTWPIRTPKSSPTDVVGCGSEATT